MNKLKIQKVLNRFWQSGDNLEKEIIHIDDEKDLINDLFDLYSVVSAFYCEDEDLDYQTKKCTKQCDGCSFIEKRVAK